MTLTTSESEVITFATADSSRIRILDTPILAPGVCCICGAGRNDDRKYIDLGIDVDYIGVMYFCTFCMTELANTLGCLMPEQAQQLRDELDSARQTIINFQQEKAAVHGAVDAIRRTGLFSGTDFNSLITTPEKSDDFELVNEPGSDSTERKTSGSNKDTKQSDPKQGSDDIPEFGSNDLESFL